MIDIMSERSSKWLIVSFFFEQCEQNTQRYRLTKKVENYGTTNSIE